ncbi:MAG: hypothetical protein GC180_06165 [Bacteroidetes bacterium]|nr:hypothetical protein [Bacteroidota bacterium]
MKWKGYSIKKIVNTAVWTTLILFVVVVLGMARNEQENTLCSNVNIEMKPDYELLFTGWDDVAKMITGDGNVASMQGKPLSTFRVGELEQTLELSPFIRNAEVYTEMDGTLSIEVEQRQPLFRVFRQNSKGYYVDKEGKKMPLSPKYSARVVVLRGVVKENYDGNDSIKTAVLADAYRLINALSENDLWRRQIDEVVVDKQGEFTLIPMVGNHKIVIGSTNNLEEKLHNLRLFYKHAMNRVGWTTYKVINLKYSGQVVCEK